MGTSSYWPIYGGNHKHKDGNHGTILHLGPSVLHILPTQTAPPLKVLITLPWWMLFWAPNVLNYDDISTQFVHKHKKDVISSITELTIEAYTAFFRKEFPNETVPPKMHLLERHTVPFIRQWQVGLGFHGEQGGESVHARLNTIQRDVRGLKDDLAILESVMKTHWLQTHPGAIWKENRQDRCERCWDTVPEGGWLNSQSFWLAKSSQNWKFFLVSMSKALHLECVCGLLSQSSSGSNDQG